MTMAERAGAVAVNVRYHHLSLPELFQLKAYGKMRRPPYEG